MRAALFAGKRAALVIAVDEKQQALTAAGLAEAEAAATLAGAEATLAALRRDLDGAQERLAAARDEEARTDALAQRREAEEAAARREAAEASERRDAARVEAERLASSAQTLRAAGHRAGGRSHRGRGHTRAHTSRRREAASESAQATDNASHEVGTRAEDARRTLLAAAASATEARNRVHRLEVELEQDAYQRTRLTAEHERLGAHLAQLAHSEAEAAARESAAAAAAAEIERERQALRAPPGGARLARRRADRSARRGRPRALAGPPRARGARAPARRGPRAAHRPRPRAARRASCSAPLPTSSRPSPEVARLLDRAYGDLLNLPVCADEEAAAALVAQRPERRG